MSDRSPIVQPAGAWRAAGASLAPGGAKCLRGGLSPDLAVSHADNKSPVGSFVNGGLDAH
jgi:hypothetical protein